MDDQVNLDWKILYRSPLYNSTHLYNFLILLISRERTLKFIFSMSQRIREEGPKFMSSNSEHERDIKNHLI